MFCLNCGKEIANDALYCPYCNSATENVENASASPVINDEPAKNSSNTFGLIAVILGALGVVLAWLIALLGHLFGGAALALSIIGKCKDSSPKKATAGLVLAIITLVFSFINSVWGMLIMLQLI
jgi:uncharacterized membrane protein YvbJ